MNKTHGEYMQVEVRSQKVRRFIFSDFHIYKHLYALKISQSSVARMAPIDKMQFKFSSSLPFNEQVSESLFKAH